MVDQKVNSPKSTTTSCMKSLLGKNENMMIQATITKDDPTTTAHVMPVQLRSKVSHRCREGRRDN